MTVFNIGVLKKSLKICYYLFCKMLLYDFLFLMSTHVHKNSKELVNKQKSLSVLKSIVYFQDGRHFLGNQKKFSHPKHILT